MRRIRGRLAQGQGPRRYEGTYSATYRALAGTWGGCTPRRCSSLLTLSRTLRSIYPASSVHFPVEHLALLCDRFLRNSRDFVRASRVRPAMRFDPLAYCFKRKNKIRNNENTGVAGDSQILTLRIEDDDAGNSYDKSRSRQFFTVCLQPSKKYMLYILFCNSYSKISVRRK